MIEKVLGWDFSQAVNKITYKILYKHHLRSVKHCYKNLYDLLKACYPERLLKPYYLKKHRNVWFDDEGNMKADLAREAIREFVGIITCQKEKHRLKDIPKWINYRWFHRKILPYETSLSYMLNLCFNNSPFDAIIFAYPELKLKSHYFRCVPKGYWKGEIGKNHAKEIMKELLVNLQLNP